MAGSYATSSWEKVFAATAVRSGWQYKLGVPLSKHLLLFPLPASLFRASQLSLHELRKPSNLLLYGPTNSLCHPDEGRAEGRILPICCLPRNPCFPFPSGVLLYGKTYLWRPILCSPSKHRPPKLLQVQAFMVIKIDPGSSDTVLSMWMMLSLLIKSTLLIRLPKEPFLPSFFWNRDKPILQKSTEQGKGTPKSWLLFMEWNSFFGFPRNPFNPDLYKPEFGNSIEKKTVNSAFLAWFQARFFLRLFINCVIPAERRSPGRVVWRESKSRDCASRISTNFKRDSLSGAIQLRKEWGEIFAKNDTANLRVQSIYKESNFA